MPLQRRVPKFGFTNINRVEYTGINIDALQKLVDEGKISDVVTPEILIENGLLGKRDLLKILGRGTLTAKISVTAHQFSKTALAAIEAAGGTATSL